MNRDTILVCGSREWIDAETIGCWLHSMMMVPWYGIDRAGMIRIVHGDARGADKLAALVSQREPGLPDAVFAYPVDHTLDGPWPAAGVRRNARMLAVELARIRHVLAFTTPGPKLGMTKGTADMVERCIRAGLAVTIVPPRARP